MYVWNFNSLIIPSLHSVPDSPDIDHHRPVVSSARERLVRVPGPGPCHHGVLNITFVIIYYIHTSLFITYTSNIYISIMFNTIYSIEFEFVYYR